MEDIWTFKFRLIIWDDNFKKIYLDELPNFKPHYITNSRCEYNWFEYSNDRISRGFNKDGVFMQASFNNGFLVVSIISNDPLNKLVSVLKSDYTCDSPSIVTRPLIDWLKLFLNGQISDGVGENDGDDGGHHRAQRGGEGLCERRRADLAFIRGD